MDYDACLNWSLSLKCNFECDYCFHSLEKRKSGLINPINIAKVIKTLKKANKKYLIIFSGGEPFLVPNFVELCKALTKDHYIGIVTNLSCTDVIKEFVRQIPPEKVQSIVASCHVLEYENKGINNNFFIENYYLLKKHHFNIGASYVVYPPLLPRFEKDILYYRSHGIEMYSRWFMGNYKDKNYPESYSKEERKKISKYHAFGEKETFHFKGTLCNAGYNKAIINPDGNIFACYSLPLKLGNISKKIRFNKKMLICPVESCSCPLKIYQPQLFNHACKTTTAYSPFQQNFFLRKSRVYKHIKDSICAINIPKILWRSGMFLKKYTPNLYDNLKKNKKKIKNLLIRGISLLFLNIHP